MVATQTRTRTLLEELDLVMSEQDEQHVNSLPFDEMGNRIPVWVHPHATEEAMDIIDERKRYESDESFLRAIINRLIAYGIVAPVPERTVSDALYNYTAAPRQEPSSVQTQAMAQAIDEVLSVNNKTRASDLCVTQLYGVAMDMARIFGR